MPAVTPAPLSGSSVPSSATTAHPPTGEYVVTQVLPLFWLGS